MLGLLILAAPARAQVCPRGERCVYVPPLMPPAPVSMGNNGIYGSALFFSSGLTNSSVSYTVGGVHVPDFGLSMLATAMVPMPPGTNIAGDFNVVERAGAYVRQQDGFVLALQEELSSNTAYHARIRNSIGGLGTRFRLAGYALDASCGDDTGFDYVGIYAPRACTVTARAPSGAYAQLQAQAPGRRFWQAVDGPVQEVQLGGGETILLRTRGAGSTPGARGFPLDGTLITATAPISVTSGGRGWAFDGNGQAVGAGDGADGAVPVVRLGTQYVVRNYPSPVRQEVRITTDTDNTQVMLNGSQLAVLDAGETYTLATPQGVSFIEGSQKLIVYQQAGLYGGNIDMALVQPLWLVPEVRTQKVAFTIATGSVGMVFAVVPSASLASVRLNNQPYASFPNTQVAQVPGHPEWTTVTFTGLPVGEHVIGAGADVQVAILSGDDNPGVSRFAYISIYRRPHCGDGVLDFEEACDDGNLVNYDGCSSLCDVEPGYTCAGEPSVCREIRVDAAPDAEGSTQPGAAVDPLEAGASCRTVGCPDSLWCDGDVCVPQLANAIRCRQDRECLANVCGPDGLCGQKPGATCDADTACRSSICDGHVCVDLDARGEGSGFLSCAAVHRPGPFGRADWFALFASAAAILGLRRRRAGRPRLGGLVSFWLAPLALVASVLRPTTAAAAVEPGVMLSPLPPTQAGAPWLVLDGFAPPPERNNAAHSFTLRVSGNYAHRPFLITSPNRPTPWGAIVAHQAALGATATYWWQGRLRLSLTLPYQVWAQGADVPASPLTYAPPSPSAAVGDVALSGAWVAGRWAKSGLRLAVGATLQLPTGNTHAYAGNGKLNGGLQVGLTGRRGRWDMTLISSALTRQFDNPNTTLRLPIAYGLSPGVGLWFLRDRVHLGLEVPFSRGGSRRVWMFSGRAAWVDPILSLRYVPVPSWAATLGVGAGITRSVGEANWRLLAAIDYSPRRAQKVRPSAPVPAAAVAVAAAPAEVAAIAPTPDAIAPAEVVALPYRLQFALSSAEPANDGRTQAALAAVAAYVAAHAEISGITVVGHTDTRGPGAYNLDLSRRRAAAVRARLIALGAPEHKVHCAGRGAMQPLADNSTRPGRIANRRVTFEATTSAVAAP